MYFYYYNYVLLPIILFIVDALPHPEDIDCLIFRLYMQLCVVVDNRRLLFMHLNSIVYNDVDEVHIRHIFAIYFPSPFSAKLHIFAVFCASRERATLTMWGDGYAAKET